MNGSLDVVMIHCPTCAEPIEVEVHVAKVRSDGRELIVSFSDRAVVHRCQGKR